MGYRGYWESWSSKKTGCGAMPPSQIPASSLNEVNFAFAYVDPDTFQILPMPGTDESDFKAFAAVEQSAPDTKFWVSIGGWSFFDNDTVTQPVMSNIASSEANRKQFAEQLVIFCHHYGFTGVDLDWEYPGAPDRGGRPDDVQNFPLLLEAIKAEDLPYLQGPLDLSITVPTSYWYLRVSHTSSFTELGSANIAISLNSGSISKLSANTSISSTS